MNPPAVPLHEVFSAALGMQLRQQCEAARLDLEGLPPLRLQGFQLYLQMEAQKHTQSLAVYCLAFPPRAAEAIHEAATTTVANTIKTFLAAITAQ